jgi:23S rRNA (uracil1939-C5)-methyltransferase
MENRRAWRRDEIVEAQVTSLTYEGQGVARVEGMVIFVRGALPGDTARIRLTKIKKSFAEGQAVAIVSPSPWRVAPRCRHFGVCGGCVSQDLSYEKQLEFKAQNIRENISHLGGLQVDVRPTLGMADPWRYRNKMEFAFGEREGSPFLGLMQRGSFDQVVPITDCHLATPRAMQAVRAGESFARERGLHAFDARQRTGTMRHLVVREGMRTGDLLLNMVSFQATQPDASLVAAMQHLSPNTVLWTHNNTFGSVVQADRLHVLSGSGEISERIGNLKLLVGPFSFLQTNSEMVEVLYNEIASQAQLTGTECVLDLYCGVGAIGLFLAHHARQVVGIESVPEAVALARRNAEVNGIANVEFQRAEVEALSILSLGAIAPDVVLLDPPRAGLHPRLLDTLRELRCPKIVYISCNPAALARDLKALSDLYTIGSVQPVDMFPHTWHIESVVTLTRSAT